MLPHQAKNQKDFILAAFEHCSYVPYGHFEPIYSELNWVYKLGRDLKILSLDYLEFEMIMKNKHKNYYDGIEHRYNIHVNQTKRKIINYSSRHSHFCDSKWYRVLVKFTHKGEKKKHKDNSWRIHKRFDKDKNTTGRRYGNWKKYLKHYCARNHRAYERDCIKNERYDDFHNRTYKQSENPWNWD